MPEPSPTPSIDCDLHNAWRRPEEITARLTGHFREREGCILRCPWHGWEFDIATGESVFNPHGPGVETYPVAVADGLVVVTV